LDPLFYFIDYDVLDHQFFAGLKLNSAGEWVWKSTGRRPGLREWAYGSPAPPEADVFVIPQWAGFKLEGRAFREGDEKMALCVAL